MKFRILGPVEVLGTEAQSELSASKLRTVLAVLLLARSRVVSDSALGEMLWGDDPPATASAQIQTYVSRLRQKLGADARIVRQRPGYLLKVRPDQLDLFEFERLAAQGRKALEDGRHDEAAETLAAALAVWQGPPLGGVTEPLSRIERPHLEEAHLAVLEDRIAADTARGRHAELVAELTGLVATHPLRERLRSQLMIALYRTGRQADALAVYRDYRKVLSDELGIDPGSELRELHETILAAPAVDQHSGNGWQSGDAWQAVLEPAREVAPAQLPPDITDFTGRKKEVAQVSALLRPDGTNAAIPAACVITGMAGIGKTALAVHVAHRCRAGFPDGQIYTDLRGSGPQPADPADVLSDMLKALGVDPDGIPEAFGERAKLYRSLLTDRRVLVLLDNAANEQQLRPLLPGNSGCGVLVTCRARLSALEGVPLIDLDVLCRDEALELLTKTAGTERVASEPEAAEQIIGLCGNLPLGVRIAGARLAAKPHWRSVDLARRLADQRSRLDELRLADLEVRASVVLSYQGLGKQARRAFRLLALLDVRHFALWTAAVVLDVTVAVARDLLEQLVDARLLEVMELDQDGTVRYLFHDLVRVFALERVEEEETAGARYAALDRAYGTWLSAVD